MPNISVRKINQDVYTALLLRAKAHGVSMEEEVRRIITEAVSQKKSISSIFSEHFSDGMADTLKIPSHKSHNPIDLNHHYT
jgi:hypothetical protein